tara:strand:- start:249 stop:419 length:171 start_codon:yes stop_codon:yes gene_type:complete
MKRTQSNYVSISEAAKIIGLSAVTLRRYEKQGKFSASFRTFGNHRRYNINELKKSF